MTKSVTKFKDLGYGWTGTLYSDGTMRVQGDLQESDGLGMAFYHYIDIPKDSVDRLARIFKEIQRDTPYTSNG